MFSISFPDGHSVNTDDPNIRDARITAFNLLQVHRMESLMPMYSAHISRITPNGVTDMGYVNDDGLWTRDHPMDGGFFMRSDSGLAGWRPIVRRFPVMYDPDDPNRMYYDAGLFTREAVLAREMWERGSPSVVLQEKV